MTSLRVYVAGCAASMPRIHRAIAALKANGITVTCTWPEVIATQSNGVSNPRDASTEDRARWSQTDLDEVAGSDLVWFLVPHPEVTRGAWVEMGWALALGKALVCSGDTKQSVFCALGHEYMADDEALAFVLKWRDCSRLIAARRDTDPKVVVDVPVPRGLDGAFDVGGES